MQNTYEEWKQFLGRTAICADYGAISVGLKGKRVLITGAGGSIGSALAKQCTQFQVEKLVLLDSAEKGIYELDDDLTGMNEEVSRCCIVGDVCDESLLEELFTAYRPQLVFHAAACKHVPLMERNPFTAARTNIVGTYQITRAAARHTVEKLILLSTDKVVDAASVMGATKRIAELILLANSSNTQMKAVRLGNVLGSSGSVVPLFLKQIAAEKPVTVTHPDATRYFITLEEAVSLLLEALLDTQTNAILIPEVGEPRSIEELARFLVGHTTSPVEFTQLRPGDKLHEQMRSEKEPLIENRKGTLHTIYSAALPAETIHALVQEIAEAGQRRDLGGLLRFICSAVPEYRPGAWLGSQLYSGKERR